MKKDLKVGNSAILKRVFTESDVKTFAELSTDKNPLHLDKDFAADTVFGEPVVHGALVASLFSGLLGMTLPGEGTIYLGQTLSFKAPVRVGEEVTASVEIVKIRDDKPIVTLRTICINGEGEVAIEGEAVVKAP